MSRPSLIDNFLTPVTELPRWIIISVIGLCFVPIVLQLCGVNFGVPPVANRAIIRGATDTYGGINSNYRLFVGDFIHLLLEWSAVSLAFFSITLAFARFSITPDVTVPIIGVTLFCAGLTDAFHALSAIQLIHATAPGHNFIHFTWLLCRMGNAILPMIGVILCLVGQPKRVSGNLRFVLGISLGFGLLVSGIMYLVQHSAYIPTTVYPDRWVARPWDLLPFSLFAIAGIFIYPRFYHQYPSLFSHSLLVATIPSMATQLFMAFGSRTSFDAGFNIAHFFKVVAYAVPLIGLVMDYVNAHRQIKYVNHSLSLEIDERMQIQDILQAREASEREKSNQLSQTLEDLKLAQTQLIQSEKMSALGNLVSGVAHEINNPLNFLAGNIEPATHYAKQLFGVIDLYQEKFPEPGEKIQAQCQAIELDYLREDFPKLLASMTEGVDRIYDISNSLRIFSRSDTTRPILFDVHNGLESTILLLKHRLKATELRPNIEIIREYGDLPKIRGFAGQLNQVFMNIISNAIDALEESNQGLMYGEIFENPNVITICTACSADQQMAIIRIKDNGIGMPESVQQKMFEHLFTTKEVGKGTGLGLAIAHQIVVEKHEGTIEVDSTPNQGTEFIIKIPIESNRGES